jgi:hypothetical protein
MQRVLYQKHYRNELKMHILPNTLPRFGLVEHLPDPSQNYRQTNLACPCEKNGQLKLFLSTLRFIAKLEQTHPNIDTIYYAGGGNTAKPKHPNLETISELYPNFRFIILDPARSGPEGSNIFHYNKCFTKEDAHQLSGERKAAFMCDVRTDMSNLTNRLVDEDDDYVINQIMMKISQTVITDLDRSLEWMHIMQLPSLLKFACPWFQFIKRQSIVLLGGEIWTQAFTKYNGNETRYYWDPDAVNRRRVVKFQDYDDSMYSYNYFERCYSRQHFSKSLSLKLTKCDCNDCIMLAKIGSKFISDNDKFNTFKRYVTLVRQTAFQRILKSY